APRPGPNPSLVRRASCPGSLYTWWGFADHSRGRNLRRTPARFHNMDADNSSSIFRFHVWSLALGKSVLGVEGLERFARREPLRRVHECVFGVLALESEPVDPRL